jgi:hypothetical protein
MPPLTGISRVLGAGGLFIVGLAYSDEDSFDSARRSGFVILCCLAAESYALTGVQKSLKAGQLRDPSNQSDRVKFHNRPIDQSTICHKFMCR